MHVFTTTEKILNPGDVSGVAAAAAAPSPWASTLSSHWAKLALYSNVITTGNDSPSLVFCLWAVLIVTI